MEKIRQIAKMELILYNKDFDNFEAKICGVIESVVSKEKTAIFRSIENMIERIMHLTYNPEIVVLIIKKQRGFPPTLFEFKCASQS